jgi:hypothetical protein
MLQFVSAVNYDLPLGFIDIGLTVSFFQFHAFSTLINFLLNNLPQLFSSLYDQY